MRVIETMLKQTHTISWFTDLYVDDEAFCRSQFHVQFLKIEQKMFE